MQSKGKRKPTPKAPYLRLQAYLSRHENCRRELAALHARRAALAEQLSCMGEQSDNCYGNVNWKVATAAFRRADERLAEQMAKTAYSLQDILGLFELLPNGSDARMILEYRYIDGLTWLQVSARMRLSVRWCCARRDAGLRQIWSHPDVRAAVNRWAEKYYPRLPVEPEEAEHP